ncbi:MAG: PAS domain-containing protein [Proteobacteria bacterium]|nr:PAS domain-containing protein [Pseudomonadota bacterium]MBU4463799.1 PAS domain-containing protein [Pseudomonadota bacterium]
MAYKPTYEELAQKVRELEKKTVEHKKAEIALRKLQYHLDQIKIGMHEDIMVIDRNFVIKDVNDGFIIKYGGNVKRVIGRTCYEVTHGFDKPCSKPEHSCPAAAVFNTGKPVRVEQVHRGSKGEELNVEIYAFPLFAEDGNIERVVEVFHNVTDHKQVEQKRIKIEKLEGALEMAAAVCHELGQPLQALYVHFDDMLEIISGHDALYSEVEGIMENAHRMGKIIKKLQNIARYETRDYVQGIKIIDIDKATELYGSDTNM